MAELTLTESIDEGARVTDSDIAVKLYLSFRREVHWIPDTYRNAYLALEEQSDRDFFMAALAEQVYTARAGRVNVIDAVGDVSETLFRDSTESLRPMTLAEAGQSVIDASRVAQSVNDKCHEAGLISPPTRYFDVLVLRASQDQLERMCKVEVIAEALKHLARDGMDSRIPLVVVTDSASRRHLPVLREVNWASYMGTSNVEFAEKLYAELKPGLFNPGRIKLGVLAAFDRDYLSVLQPLKYIPSAWGAMKKTRQKAERKVYEDFLEGLRVHDDDQKV